MIIWSKDESTGGTWDHKVSHICLIFFFNFFLGVGGIVVVFVLF